MPKHPQFRPSCWRSTAIPCGGMLIAFVLGRDPLSALPLRPRDPAPRSLAAAPAAAAGPLAGAGLSTAACPSVVVVTASGSVQSPLELCRCRPAMTVPHDADR